jgi:hypothetical protein
MSPDTNMTFLYNEQILKEFSKLLEPKVAQQAPQQAFTPAQMQDVALKLLNNIKISYSPIEVADNAQLFSRNAQNLNELTAWMLNNKVIYNGHPIVLSDKFQLDKAVPYVEFNNAYVWKDGLVEFLKDLQNQSKDSGNNLFMQHVSGLISDANTELQAGLVEESVKPAVDTTKENQQAQQQDQQQTAQQGQGSAVQQAVYNTNKVLKQRTGSDSIELPFDVDTNDVDIRRINDFTNCISFTFQTAIAPNKWGMIESQVQQISGALTRWNSVATPEAREGGFQLSINTDIDSFVNTYANKDFAKALAMLNNLVPLFQGTHNLLNTLLASPVYVNKLGGAGNITNQASRAQEMITWAQHWISRIEDVLRNNARK